MHLDRGLTSVGLHVLQQVVVELELDATGTTSCKMREQLEVFLVCIKPSDFVIRFDEAYMSRPPVQGGAAHLCGGLSTGEASLLPELVRADADICLADGGGEGSGSRRRRKRRRGRRKRETEMFLSERATECSP
ncbi:hypothetical protein EYF80_006504 [Liparis tanakae]|uniref:Uncharacterized protein n=1 Tax=Liparis tanakae TaxID=230148 RepID=A0A4Z2IZK3_9TELE|nr:hypothetical protein EYF80_006504 [Liparis tanakae]